MTVYPVYKNISIASDDTAWGNADIAVYKIIIRDIVVEYEQLGFEADCQIPIVVQHSPFDYPMCSNGGGVRIIFLCTQDNYWCQLAYQFAHEYCHHLINGPMDGENSSSFWFEESLCELSSIYFMRKMSKRWVDEGTRILDGFASSVLRYCDDNWTSISLTDNLPLWIAQNMSTLSDGYYHRDMYKVIAKSLFPLFENYPDMWKLLPFLKRVPQSGYESFNYWLYNIVPLEIPEELQYCFNLLRSNVIN